MRGIRSGKFKYADAAFLLCFAAGLCFLVWRAPLGFGSDDEAFYLTVPYRLAMGDALLRDEWHVSQLAGFLLLPAVKLYLAVKPDTEGMLLFFRYLCVGAQALSALYVYLRLRKDSAWGAMLAALVFLLYIPFNISALSYNSMGIFLMAAAGATIAAADTHMRRDMLLAGLLFAGAVLCCPHLVLVYVVYCAMVLVCLVVRKRRKASEDTFSFFALRSWLPFSMGAAALAAVFFLFVLSRVDIRSLVNSVLVILNDPEHPSASLFDSVLSYFDSILNIHSLAPYAMCGCAALFFVVILDKKRFGRRRMLYALLAAMLCGIYYAPFLVDGLSPIYYAAGIETPRYVNYLMYPLNILGLFAYLLSQRRSKRLLYALFIPGMLYGFCVHLSSNQRFYNIASVAAVAMLASVVFIVQFIAELWPQRRGCRAVAAVLAGFIAVQLGAQIFFRLNFAFDEDTCPTELTHSIAYGPEKGLVTTKETAHSRYYDVYEATADIREKSDGNVLYFSKRTWLYLADSKTSAAYSAWLSFVDPDRSLNKVLYYWTVLPNRQADYIFVAGEFEHAEEYIKKLNLNNYPVIETPSGYIVCS